MGANFDIYFFVQILPSVECCPQARSSIKEEKGIGLRLLTITMILMLKALILRSFNCLCYLSVHIIFLGSCFHFLSSEKQNHLVYCLFWKCKSVIFNSFHPPPFIIIAYFLHFNCNYLY